MGKSLTRTRGTVEIRNRSALESAACECYSAIVKQQARWQKESEEHGGWENLRGKTNQRGARSK
jgi:hypothetical protein